MDISVIIVNWNSQDYLRNCVQSIKATVQDWGYEIIVLDNASFDGSKELVEHEFPSIRFVQLKSNLGFGAANNDGADIAQGRILLFLNPDTEVQPAAIATMMEVLENNPDAGIVGCRLLNTDGSIQKSCVQSFPTLFNQIFDANWLRNLFPGWSLWGNSAIFDRPNKAVEVDAVSGACMMMYKSTFHALNGFSREYFMYCEDLDLCYKAHRSGLRVLYVDPAEIIHHGGKSSDRETDTHFASVMQREAMLTFMKRHKGSINASLFRTAMAAGAIMRILILSIGRLSAYKVEERRTLTNSLYKWRAILTWALFRTGKLQTEK